MDKKPMERVYICECWARDGLQNIPQTIPTAEKLEMLNKFAQAGYARIETTSFSNPKRVPQFADAEEILQRIERVEGVCYKATCINARALDRTVETAQKGYGPTEVSFMISVSQAHDQFNTKMTHAQRWAEFASMAKICHDNHFKIVATLGTVYGCPLTGNVAPNDVWDFVKRYLDLGVDYICLGDTTGAGNPRAVKEMFGELIARYPDVKYIAHFHDTRGTGVANCVAAYESGVRYFDSALGGIGGQPAGYGEKYHLGFSGNVCTEDLVCMFEEMGISTGIDQDRVIELGLRAEEILGERQRSNVIRCGKVKH
jgi:hydroxymethylglutaryl-CoA lyase